MRVLIKPLIVSLIVGSVFLIYLAFIGIPKTQARNLYNEGLIQIQQGNITEGLELYKKAYSTWPEEYIQKEISDWGNF